MSPVESLQTLLRVNKPVAIFLFSGLAVLAAAAIALTWAGNSENMMIVAAYILGLGFAVTLLTFVITNRNTRSVLGWMLTGLFVLFMIGLVDSAVGATGRLPTPACYVRLLWEHPRACEARLFPIQQVSLATAPRRLAATRGGPERLWFAQAGQTPEPRATPYDAGPIFLHHGDLADLSALVQLSEELRTLGWPIESVERVARLPDQTEVRYFEPGVQADALALARTLKAVRPDHEVFLRDFTKSGLLARKGLLEIWLAG